MTGSLVSLGQLCDDDCIAIFTKYHVDILKNNQTIIKGERTDNGLWSIPLSDNQHKSSSSPHAEMANGIIRKDKTKSELAAYYAACCYNMRPSTLLRAIRLNYFTTWPGMTTSLISKHLPKSVASSKGHLDQEKTNLQSTKIEDLDVEEIPTQERNNIRTNNIMCTMVSTKKFLSKSYSDQTGKFPTMSSRGNQYVFILYHYDTNSIHAVPIKNRQAAHIKNAWHDTFNLLKHHGEAPDLHILDNECSGDLRKAFLKNDIAFQKVPAHIHRRNAAERAIRTFKNHLIAGLCTCDPEFPIAEWDRLLPQAILTLNLVRTARRNPSLSAHAAIFGNYDFRATPLAPPGTRVLVHLKPSQQTSFGTHGLDGWYIGPAFDHYRCYQCFMPATNSILYPDTVDFFPSHTPFPSVTTDDYLRQAASDLLTILQAPKKNIPTLTYGSAISNAYIHLAQILKRATQPPTTPQNKPPSSNKAPLRITAKEPRVAPPDIPIEPEVLPTNNSHASQEPRVVPTRSPTPKPSPSPMPTLQQAPTAIPPLPTVIPKASNVSQSSSPVQHPTLQLHHDTHHNDIYAKRYFKRDTSSIGHRRHTRAQTRLAPAQSTIAQQKQHHMLCHVFDTDGHKESIASLRQGKNGIKWTNGLSNEIGRLAQGVGKFRCTSKKIIGTNTIHFIPHHQVPADSKVTYANFVCNYRPLKDEPYRVRCTVGGDRLDYEHDPRSPAASLLDIKIHVNSTISDAHKGARYATSDIENFYLNTPMQTYRYMRIALKDIPDEILQEYNLTPLVHHGYLYVEIRKGMYGLKEAGIIAYNNLVKNMKPHGYYPVTHTPGIWRHKTLPTTFTLAVDDFGIKYFHVDHANHLLNAIKTNYNIKTDWTGRHYCGLTLDWHYQKRFVDISMPGYVTKALQKFLHEPPKRNQHAPHQWITKKYGQQVQFAIPPSNLPVLDRAGTKKIQAITGTFLYYGRAVDPCILPACNEIGSQQAVPTSKTVTAANMLMDYLHTYPSATIRYHTSDMCLHIDSDAAYLVHPRACSRVVGNFYLSNNVPQIIKNPQSRPNGPILTECRTVCSVMYSTVEVEVI